MTSPVVPLTKLLGSFVRAREGAAGSKLTGVIDPSWSQGRTCFGGIGAAVAVTNAQALIKDTVATGSELPVLRSLSASFVGPIAPGSPISVLSAPLRQGKSVAAIETKVYQDDQCCLALQAAFGVSRSTTAHVDASRELRDPRTSIPDREAIKPLRLTGAPHEPRFLQQFEVRAEMGLPFPPQPFQGRRFSGWIRLKDDDAHVQHPTARLLAISDVPAPLMMLHYKVPITGSTLTWSLEFVQNPERVATTWFYLDYHLDAAADGYSQQSGTIYDESGAVVALSRQCMVYFEPKAAPAAAPAPAAVDAASTTASA